MNKKKAEAIKDAFGKMYADLKHEFIFKDFNIHIEPCGQVNAFSETNGSGDIHLCTELFDNVAKSNNPGALTFIFLHELGHTLLGLWKLPGNNNEDIADEFATYVMLQGEASAGIQLNKSLNFWRNRNVNAEVTNMIQNGDRHSLSIQRIRNIEENIQNNHEFSIKWSRLIYPHMTTQGLQDVIEHPSENSNLALAKSLLAKKGIVISDVKKPVDTHQVTESIAERLKKLKILYKDGLLTKEEYASKKKEILDEL